MFGQFLLFVRNTCELNTTLSTHSKMLRSTASLLHLAMLLLLSAPRFCVSSDPTLQSYLKDNLKPLSANKPKKLPRVSKQPGDAPRQFKTVQVHIVHRHGDRTPITPLKNEAFWKSALPKADILSKIAESTKLIRDNDSDENTHFELGKGPFGKLTQMGLFQMVELGSKLREELYADDEEHHVDEDGNHHLHKGRLFTPGKPLDSRFVKVASTDFPRTIQSVQGLLIGLLPDGPENNSKSLYPIEIDVRHTNTMIPDPQPRQSTEQVELETILALRPHLQEQELKMKALAIRTTEALRHALGEGAYDIAFGVGEEKSKGTTISAETEPLPWTQLSEITKCLQVRDLLPPSISNEDQEAISSHAAWRWFENLRHPRLAHLASGDMCKRMLDAMHLKKGSAEASSHEEGHPLHIYSAHDSTLIGLLCAFRLEQPSQWPEYGSYLKVELIEATALDESSTTSTMGGKEHYVRFSLNGEVLRCYWGTDKDDEPVEMICLEDLLKLTNMPPASIIT